MREAQALVTPVMLVLMLPWLLTAPVGATRTTTMTIALSFIPPVNTLADDDPDGVRLAAAGRGRVWLPCVIGVGSAVVADVVCRKDLQHRPADARQAAERWPR